MYKEYWHLAHSALPCYDGSKVISKISFQFAYVDAINVTNA